MPDNDKKIKEEELDEVSGGRWEGVPQPEEIGGGVICPKCKVVMDYSGGTINYWYYRCPECADEYRKIKNSGCWQREVW